MWTLGTVKNRMDQNTLSQQPWYGPAQFRVRVVPVKHKIGLLTKKSKQQLLREEMPYRPIIMGLCFSIIMYTHTIQTSIARSQ